jgi:hypothetical protein
MVPERELWSVVIRITQNGQYHPNGEKAVFMWDDKPAAIEPQEETKKDRTHKGW